MSLISQGGVARARLRPEPPVVQIGQSVTWTLIVEHPLGSAVHLGEAFSSPHLGWAEEGRGQLSQRQDGEPADGAQGLLTTKLSWTGLPLESGDLMPPGGEIAWSGPNGREGLVPEVLSLKVHGELAAGEDLPPAPPGMASALVADSAGLSGTAGAVAWALPLCLLLMAAVVGLCAWALVRRRRAARTRAQAVPTPGEALARLRAEQSAAPGDDGETARRLEELSAILRRPGAAAPHQGHLGGPLTAGLTDEEWLTKLVAEKMLAPEHLDEAREFCAALSATRFARRRPTRFAVERLLEQGQVLLNNLERAAATGVGARGGGA